MNGTLLVPFFVSIKETDMNVEISNAEIASWVWQAVNRNSTPDPEVAKSFPFDNWGAQFSAISNRPYNPVMKAISGGYGTDEAALTGGPALRLQSLDPVVKDLIPGRKQFTMLNLLRREPIYSLVDYYIRRPSEGGYPGSGFSGTSATATSYNQDLSREAGLVRIISHFGQVEHIALLEQSVTNKLLIEQQAVMTRVLQDAEFQSFEGDTTINPNGFNGLRKEIEDNVSDNVIDRRGGTFRWSDVLESQATVDSYGKLGEISDVIMSPRILKQFSSQLDDLPRAILQQVQLDMQAQQAQGAIVPIATAGIATDWGFVKPHRSIYISEDFKRPQAIKFPNTISETGAPVVPASVVAAKSAAVNPLFTADHAGRYFYVVEAWNASGYSNVTASNSVDVIAGDQVALTIADPASGVPTGYRVFRSKKLGGAATVPSSAAGTDNYRYIGKVTRTGAATVFTDTNFNIPGTDEVYCITNDPMKDAIDYRQFAEPFQFPLYPSNTTGAVHPFLGIMALYLRVTKPEQHVLIKNVLPTDANWKPFG
jgi:hypothetical protein